MTKQIELTQNKIVLVSDHRFEYLNQWKWDAYWSGQKWYAVRHKGKRSFKKLIKMHREIMGVVNNPKIEVCHIDFDGLNNQDDNLRLCTHAQSLQNRGKQKNNTSGFKGVTWNKRSQKYVAKLQVDGKYIHLGLFSDPIEAAHAYDDGARRYHGEFANTNF